jgi:uncharacterized membrane protein YGL010W
MTDDAVQRAHDAEEHRKSYQGIMRASTEVGVPLAIALTLFFTSLVMANGVLLSMLLGVVVYVASHLIVKLFFSHH